MAIWLADFARTEASVRQPLPFSRDEACLSAARAAEKLCSERRRRLGSLSVGLLQVLLREQTELFEEPFAG